MILYIIKDILIKGNGVNSNQSDSNSDKNIKSIICFAVHLIL